MLELWWERIHANGSGPLFVSDGAMQWQTFVDVAIGAIAAGILLGVAQGTIRTMLRTVTKATSSEIDP